MASPDSNTWYHLAPQNRSDLGLRAGSPLTIGNAVELANFGYQLQYQSWQFFRDSTSTNGTYYILRTKGMTSSEYYLASDTDPNNRNAIGVYSHNFTGARWSWTPWGDGSFKLANEHVPDSALDWQDTSNFDALYVEAANSVNTGQHWTISTLSPINDDTFSSLPSAALTTVVTDNNSSGLSTGATAGIGVGVAVVVVLLLLGAFLIFWRRRKQRRAQKSQEPPSDLPEATQYSYGPKTTRPSELDTTAREFELSGSHNTTTELPGSYTAPAELQGLHSARAELPPYPK